MGDLAREASAAAVRRWMAAYEEAWRSPGVAGLRELFTDQGTVSPRPVRAVDRGPARSKRDWEAEREGPDKVFSMTSSVLAVDPPVVVVVRTEVPDGRPAGQEYRKPVLWMIEYCPDGRVDRSIVLAAPLCGRVDGASPWT